MNTRFRQTFKFVTAAHGLALLALLIGPRFQGCGRAAPEMSLPVTLRMEAAPPPERSPDPDPIPPKPDPAPPKPDPAPPPKPRPRPEIEVSQKRVVRELDPKRERVFRDDMVQDLEKKLTTPDRPVTADDSPIHLQRVRDTLYRAWEDRPSRQEAGGATATVTIHFEASGRVANRALTGPSGNAALDASVMKAVQSVTWIPGLTEDFLRQRNYRVSVAFRLE